MINSMRLLKRSVKAEKDPEVKMVLQQALRAQMISFLFLILNCISIVLITIGYIFCNRMGFWFTHLHGALTGIFVLGTVKWLYYARNNRRNS